MNEIREKEIKNKIYRGLEQYIYTLEQNYNSSRILCMQKHREQIISWSEKKIYSRKLVGSEKKIKNKIYRGLEQYICTREQNYNSSIILCIQKHREQIISWTRTI